MTRRQVYFCDPNSDTYYISCEFNGDREEMERFGSSNSCDKTWSETMDMLNRVHTLLQFMEVVAQITRCYHPISPPELPGTRLIVKRSRDFIECKDETYGIVSGKPGIFLDKEFSVWDGETDG